MVCGTVVKFIKSHRRQNFVSLHHPVAASLIPIYLYFFTSFLLATTHNRFFTVIKEISIMVAPYDMYFFLCSIANGIFSLSILCMPRYPRIFGRFVRTFVHLTLVGGAICGGWAPILINFWSRWNEFLVITQASFVFYLYCVCCTVNFFLGILLMPSKDLAPRLFAPILRVLICSLHKLAYFFCGNFLSLLVWYESRGPLV